MRQNNLPKVPEKGILKKSGIYGPVHPQENWADDTQSDNQVVLGQPGNKIGCHAHEVRLTRNH